MATSKEDLQKMEKYRKMLADYELEQDLNKAFLSVQTEQELKKLSDELLKKEIKELEDQMNNLLVSGFSSRNIVDDLMSKFDDLSLKVSEKDLLRERISKLREKLNLLEGRVPKPKHKMPIRKSVLTQRADARPSRDRAVSRVLRPDIPTGIVKRFEDDFVKKTLSYKLKSRKSQRKPRRSASKPRRSASKPRRSASKPRRSASKPSRSASKPRRSASKPRRSVRKA